MVTKNRSVVAGSRQEGPGSIHDGNLKFPSRRKSKVQEAPEYEYFYHPLHVIVRDPNAIGISILFAQIREGYTSRYYGCCIPWKEAGPLLYTLPKLAET